MECIKDKAKAMLNYNSYFAEKKMTKEEMKVICKAPLKKITPEMEAKVDALYQKVKGMLIAHGLYIE